MKRAFDMLALRDYDLYTNNFVGSLVKKGMAFSRSFEILTDTLLFNVFTNLLPIIFAVVVLWRYSFWVPLVLLFWLGVTILISLPIIRGRSKLVAARHDASSKLTGRFSDAMTNILAIKSFAQERREGASFGKFVDKYTDGYKSAANYQNINFESVISPIYVITNVFGLVVAVFFTLRLGLPVGATMLVFSYYSQITRIFWEINRTYRNIESSISEAAEFTQLLLSAPEIEDRKNASLLVAEDGSISFKNVNFKYGEGDDAAMFLNNFNLEIRSKEKIGLVGLSGGSKTTITKLLLRFIDIESGSLTIDGQDVRSVTQASLRETIAYVPQEPLLFHRSLFENIAYGGDDTTTLDDVVLAARLAHADEFITQLPQGYETLVGERGVKLSGGQRQRVAIARALLKKSPIIILDEATSSLDSESEKFIQEGLFELMKDKTAVVIAHRLSTIKHLDRIIVLDHGEIVEDGTHDQLLENNGLYAKLWSHQSGGMLED
jgi:ATP-binding cassette subfamily B protein